VTAALYRSVVPSDGVNVMLSDGEAAGQEVMHVHLHVVPRFWGDGFVIRTDFRRAAREDLDASAAVIRAAWSG
jgi:diadenosine tetraphosphate (Ap4A) HIT family hydrolase